MRGIRRASPMHIVDISGILCLNMNSILLPGGILLATTIKDVAKRAGVSVTTVSRALNHHDYISDATMQKINHAMVELNYSPNQVARNLFHSKTQTIGLVIPSISCPFFGEMTQLIEQKLYDIGYHVLLCTTDGDHARESDIFDILRQHRMDGIIIGSPSLPDSEYSRVGIPIVAFDTLMTSASVSIAANHRLGGQMAADILLKSGCRRFLQIVGNPEAKTGATERHPVFLERAMAAGYPCVSIPVQSNFFDKTQYERIVERIFADYPDTDGFFATDLFAAEIVKCALRRGLSVPEDIQVVAYDGTYVSTITHPVLTTIRQPFEDLAQKVIESMAGLIDGKPVEKRIILDNLQILPGGTTRFVL